MSLRTTKPQIYLDNAAATPTDQRVVDAMTPYWTSSFHNPSSVYLASREVKAKLDGFRADVAHWLGANPSEVIFTAGATEANNIAVRGIAAMNEDSEALISAIEHDAISQPAKHFPRVNIIPVNSKGVVDLDHMRKLVTDKVSLISIILANNEIGVVQKMGEVGTIVKEVREDRRSRGIDMPLVLHTDASQAGNYLDLHVNKLGVDLMTLNAGKMYGPKQCGALYIRAGYVLDPLIEGGGQEKGLRSGTESLAMAAGFAAALTIAQKKRKEEHNRLLRLRKDFIAELEQLHKELVVHGHQKHTLPNIISFMVPGLDGERAVMQLDELGIQCATGSACSANKDEASHVIQALGHSSSDASATLRLSMGRDTTKEDMEAVIVAIKTVLNSKHVWG